MPTQLQLRRGTTSQNDAFTGAAGEVSVDTTTDNLRVHDGSTAGGFEIISVEPTGKIGFIGNTNPAASTVSFGVPANVVIHALAAQTGNVIIGDPTHTTAHSLDVRGTANVGALTSTGITGDVTGDLTGAVLTASQGAITTVGALDGGSITSNFGTIDTGSSAITSTGAISGGSFVVADDGNIGSASDTDAIAISAAGVVGLSATTEASATGTAALTVAGGIGVAKDMWIGDDIVMDSDLAAIKMGDAQAVTLTHVADTGVALNLGLGVADNTAPIATAISMGTPANIVLRTNTHQGNVIIGDATATSSFTLDVRGTANTAILQGTELHQANVTAAAYGKLVPSGVVVPYGSATAPVGWLLCNDDAVSRTVYADLFSAIGTLFGTGNGSTTFNVPSMGDRLPLGKGTNNGTIGGETAGAAASAVVATASGSAALTLTTGTFATSAKDSSTASALTNVTAGGHTHNLTLPVQVFQYIIKT